MTAYFTVMIEQASAGTTQANEGCNKITGIIRQLSVKSGRAGYLGISAKNESTC